MIIYSVNEKKTYETNTIYRSVDWTGKAEYIIDETDPKNAELLEKICRYAPFFEIVTNSEGEIYDIVKTADKPQLQTTESSTQSIEEIIAQLENQIAQLKNAMTFGVEVTS